MQNHRHTTINFSTRDNCQAVRSRRVGGFTLAAAASRKRTSRHVTQKATVLTAPVTQLLINARARHQTHLAARSSMLGSVIARALCSELSQIGNIDTPPHAHTSSRGSQAQAFRMRASVKCVSRAAAANRQRRANPGGAISAPAVG